NFLLAPLGLSRSSRSFRLLCHAGSASEAVRSIAARVHRTREGIAVTYSLEGQLARLRISPPRPPRIAARLWQHTCCEIFIARKGLPGYQEFNLAPSGEWAAYAFARYREGVPLVDEKLDPRISVRSSGEKLELDAFIRVDRAALSLAFAAVVEDEHGALSYWALKHPPGKPDFHHYTALCPIGRSSTRPASPISTTPMRSPRNSMLFGIDRLLEDRALRKPLAGRRVALLAHPASVTRDLVHSLDALAALGDLELVAAFGPQHGL